MTRIAFPRLFASACSILVLALVITGCKTRPPLLTTAVDPASASDVDDQSELLRSGDMLKISFRGPVTAIPDFVDRIPESGYITLPQIGPVMAVGTRRVELQETIRSNYVPRVYQQLTVTIAPEERFYSVTGEVQKPERHAYRGKMTLRDAIAAAGDFREFADKNNITVTRTDGKVWRADYPKAITDPGQYDIRILPGDKIHVPRRFY